MRLIRRTVIGGLLGGVIALTGASAQRADYTPPQLEGIEITDRAGEFVPDDLVLTDELGVTRTLGDYLNDGKPVVLQLVYFECPMLCNLVLNAFVEGARGLGWTPGEEYRVLSVSFDPDDTPELGLLKQTNYVQSLEKPAAKDGWHFLVGEKETVRRLADSVGFPYRLDKKTGDFSHAAGMFVLTPGGKISRTLYGISYPSKDLRFSLMEASEGKLGSPMEKVLLFCYRYDPNASGYVLAAINLMKLGGGLTVLALGAFLAGLWVRERKRGGIRAAGAA